MKKVIVCLLIVVLLFSISCSVAPTPTPLLTGSESDTRIGELEAKIRQLEAENQRLSSELAIATAVLQNIRSIVNSSSYINTLSELNDVQRKANELANFAQGLPHLPPLPPGITVANINDAILKARRLREILQMLPPPPPLAPSWWKDLDDLKTAFIDMTQWMENLQDLPAFLESSGSLEELRSRVQDHLGQVRNTSSSAEGMMGQVRDVATP